MLCFLARHGQTVWNQEGRWQGSNDIPLDEAGVAQAKRLAEKLTRYKIEAVYSSPLVRASVTARLAAEMLGLGVKYHDDLREICLGEWEGLTFYEISQKYPKEFLQWDYDPGAEVGMGVESNRSVQERAYAALTEICETEKRNTLILTHGGWINRLMCLLLKIPIEHRMGIRIDNTGLSILEVFFSEGEPGIKVVTINDHSHLH